MGTGWESWSWSRFGVMGCKGTAHLPWQAVPGFRAPTRSRNGIATDDAWWEGEMNNKQKRLFEVDRRMELKMRLAAKRADDGDLVGTGPLSAEVPERETLSRLIDRVRRL